MNAPRNASTPDTFYITTPIYYVNDIPHIGHAYTTLLADVLAGYHRLMGVPTFFLTGTDEHGQKVQQAAEKNGHSPKEHCDIYSLRFKEAWNRLGIGYDHFIRTTDAEHIRFVQDMLQKLWDSDRIYAKEYEGWYSLSEERFFSEKELVDGKDPISGRPVEKIFEKNYFFKMSEYQDWLVEYIETHPDFIQPDFRKNEVLGFLKQPLNDLCISRPKSRLQWGITLPFDADYVAYVWVDALFNYVSGVHGRNFPDGRPMWPADYHLIGKDILTTHAVYWPTLLKAVDLPQPRHILAHGWWMMDNARMSKTTGNVVNPMTMADVYGVDAFRYFLAREMVLGLDASFSEEAFVTRLNSDLANDLGNGLSRILKLAATGLGSRLNPVESETTEARSLQKLSEAVVMAACGKIAELKLSQGIEEVFTVVRAVNKFLETHAPWKLDKQAPDYPEILNAILFPAAEALRLCFTLLSPVMPAKMAEALGALGIASGESALLWGAWKPARDMAVSVHLFPRVAWKKEKTDAPAAGSELSGDPFLSVDLRIARIVTVTDHPNAEKLFVLEVDLGNDKRTLCAGLRGHLMAEDLLGKPVVVVANLKPANLRGVKSQGMLLAASGPQDTLLPLHPEGGAPGEKVTFEGITAAPKTQISLADFLSAPLRVDGGIVRQAGKPLIYSQGPLTSEAPDGSPVR